MLLDLLIAKLWFSTHKFKSIFFNQAAPEDLVSD